MPALWGSKRKYRALVSSLPISLEPVGCHFSSNRGHFDLLVLNKRLVTWLSLPSFEEKEKLFESLLFVQSFGRPQFT